jgi:hypothetical protein
MPALENMTREELLANYEEIRKATGQSYTVKTVPYYSTGILEFQVVNPSLSDGYAYAVARANQQVDFFHYGIGTRIPYGGNANHRATRAETNLSKANSTNGAFDLAIEQIALHVKPPRVVMGKPESFVAAGQVIDPDVLLALTGQADIYDPTAIATPQQLAAPFFNRNVLWSAVKNFISLAITFDAAQFRELGICSNFQLGNEASTSYDDVPAPEDLRFELLEGLLWARDGEPDSDLTLRGTLTRPVVVPISAVAIPSYDSGNELPTAIYLPIVVTLFGLEVGIPSSNA